MRQFRLPTQVVTGLGCLEYLPEIVREYGQTALLICGSWALHRSGTLERTLNGLKKAGVRAALFDSVSDEPDLAVVEQALDLARSEKAEVVIGMGGGSAMDAAKSVAVVFGEPGRVLEYHRGRPIQEKGLPCVCVPTTAGTGTEVTTNAVLIDRERGIKESLRGASLFPVSAVVDPELTISLPPDVTASTGADALCHAIEPFVGIGAQPPTDALAGQAIQWIGRSLERAYRQGSDIEARADMLYGSLLAGMALSNARLGGVHSVAHPLGYRYHIPHGVLCGLLLPHVMQYSLEYAVKKYGLVAQLLGSDTRGLTPLEAAQQATAVVRGLMISIGIPQHLRTFGVEAKELPELVTGAWPSANRKNNPRPLEAVDLQAILERAL